MAYAYAYAYTPGLFRTQGMKLTAMLQKQLDQGIFGNQYVDILPRGFESSAGSYLASNARSQWRVTADYALPFYAGDLSIPYVGYFRRFILTPHADYLGFGTNNLWSAGADFVADMGSLFIFTMDIKLGVSFSYLGGSAYEKTGQSKPYSVSLVFNMDI